MLKKIILLLTVNFSVLSLSAQKMSVRAQIDSNKIVIGEQTELLLKADIHNSQNIRFPVFQDTIIGGVEVIEVLEIDTAFTKGNERFLLSQKVLVTSFDSGGYVLPPFVFISDKNDTLKTNETLLKVTTVQVDTAETSVKPIHDVYDAPMTFAEFIDTYKYWLLGGFALIVAAVLTFMYFKYWRKKEETVVEKKPKKVIPPHEIAFTKLEKLKEEKLWQAGKVKKYYTELTDILREYIENRYAISTGEQTSSEILDACEREPQISDERVVELRKILTLSDLAKFAKSQPLPDENDMAFAKAKNFVQQTKESVQLSDNVKTN